MGSCMGGGTGSEGMRRSYRGTLNGVCIQLRCLLHILRKFLNRLHKEKSGPIKARFLFGRVETSVVATCCRSKWTTMNSQARLGWKKYCLRDWSYWEFRLATLS